MKHLILLFSVFSCTLLHAQFNESAPWMQDFNDDERLINTSLTFQEIVNAFDTYWETRDPNVRGSGYKPFKRWENYWKNFVKEDGTLPTKQELWDTWLDKNQKKNSRSVLLDNSNWLPLGPFTHINTGSWSSGQGRVNSIIVDPNNSTTYYSGAPAGGIWKSTDSGSTWTVLTDDLPQIGVSGIAIDYANANIIYIATGDDDAGDSYSVGVFKSIDGGLTWNATGLNPGNSPYSMNDIYIHPTNSNILWVATSSGVYRTTDAGINWTNTLSGNIKDIKIKPGDPNVVYAVSQSTFYTSLDGGITFSSSGSGLPTSSGRLVIDVTPSNPNVVYVLSATTGYGFQGLYKSTNSGISFSTAATSGTVGDIFESTQAWFDMALAVSDSDENEIYTGVLNVWKSTNGGTTMTKVNNWSSPTQPSYTHADIHLLRFYNGELFAGTDGGFYKSADGGSNFTDLTAGMQISQFYKIAVSKQSSEKMVGGLQDNGGHALNNNQWQNYYGADGMDTAIDPNNSDLFYGFIQQGGGLYISDDAGASVTASVGGPETGNWVTPLVANKEGEIYAGYSSLYKLCGSFQAISPSFGSNIDFMEIDDINPDNIYVAINNSLRKSTDKGASFTSVESFGSNITSIEVHNSNSDIVYVTTSGSSNGKVYRSDDGGLNFTDMTGSLPSVTKNIIKHQDFHSQNPLFLGTSLGVYRYDDSSKVWEAFDNGLPNVSVTDLEINYNDSNITAATYGRGIWQSDIEVETLTDELSLESIQGADATIACGDLSSVQVEVKNLGTNTINSIDVDYDLDGTNNSFTWNGNLVAGATTLIDIPTLTLTTGFHSLNITTTFNNDSFGSNNVSNAKFYANEIGSYNIVNDFETLDDELIVFDEGLCGSYWTRGVATGSVLNSSGNNVYGTELSGNHADNVKSYLFSECYDLTNVTSPTLKFDMAFDLEFNWDIMYVEYSTDGGANWNVLGTSSDPNWYNSNTLPSTNCLNCPGAQWTGTDATLQEYSYDLSAFEGQSSLTFRFVFHADQSVNQEGVILDNFTVAGTLGIDDFELSGFQIYPNPSKNIFNIKLKNTNEFEFEIYDLTGKIIVDKTKVSGNYYQLDMSSYSNGMYFINIKANNKSATRKLMLN